ncbi:CD44 antigen isoform X2 [Lissotriton helveticus]
MARLVLTLTFGLCLLAVCEADTTLHISCRYRGVYHVERNARYNLLLDEAMQLCEALNSSLATMLQMRNAWDIGFETCRYGWIDGNIVIPRIHENPICAANNTGVYILVSNITDKYDAYCYNASETREKVCDKIILPENYQFHVPIDSSLQDPKHPHRKDTEKGQQSGEDVSEDGTGDPPTDGSHHVQHPEGSSDQGAEEGVTHSSQPGDSSHVLHPGGIPGPGTEATTDAPHTGGPHEGYLPGGFIDHGSHDDSTDGPNPEDPRHGSHVDGFDDDDATDAPRPGDSGQDGHPGESPHHGSDATTDATHPGHHHHGHHPHESPDEALGYVTDVPFPDGSHHSEFTTAMDQHKRPGFNPNIDLTDDRYPDDSHYDDDTTDTPQPGNSNHGSHGGGSRGSSDTTDATHPGHSHHGHHPIGSFDQEPGDATGEPLPDDFDPSVSTSATGKPKRPGFHPSIDAAVTDSPNAAGHPDVNVQSVTESEGSDMSNFVDSNAGTDKYHGRRHQTKPNVWHPFDKDDSHSGNSVTYTDETPVSHEDHAAGVGDSESYVDGNSPHDINLDDNLETTEGDLLYSKPTGDPEGAVVRPDGAQPGGEDGPASTSNGDPRASGLSPNGEWSGEEGGSAASGGLITTKGPGYKRQPRIPDWVIIVVALVCLAVVLAVCIAVNSRCGQKKKLVINGSGGAAEGGQAGGMNGDPSKSQEMVNLVPKEPKGDTSDPQDQLVPPENTQSQQKRDMNIGA